MPAAAVALLTLSVSRARALSALVQRLVGDSPRSIGGPP
jgi:hypothetical protein